MNETTQHIQALLFHLAEPVEIRELVRMLKVPEAEVRDGITSLAQALDGTGIRLLENNDTVTLVTRAESSALIEAITKEELERDLTKAALETLAIILYKGPSTRSDVDFIRGVNSTFILRNLQVRGLIERVDNPADQRSFLYRPTNDLLQFMGVTSRDALPEFGDISEKLAAFAAGQHQETSSNDEDALDGEGSDTLEEDDSADITQAVTSEEGATPESQGGESTEQTQAS